MTVDDAVTGLVAYALRTGLLDPLNAAHARNAVLDALRLDAFHAGAERESGDAPLEDMLRALLDDARARGIVNDTTTERDLLDTRVMGCLTPPPGDVVRRFRTLREESPQAATDWFYRFCQDCDYIRRYRMRHDVRWTVPSEYGDIELSINLAKPEKDPREIAAARGLPASGYPLCQLCLENEGYAGRLNHPARQNLRIIPVEIAGEAWGFQYSPYVYYNEHCIAVNSRHIPMALDRRTFARLFSFLESFPHYFIGSNADLPIVGGSILSHDHFQGGRHDFPMAKAAIEERFALPGFPGVEAGVVAWPLSVVRLRHDRAETLADAAEHILSVWRGYDDPGAGIAAATDGVPHNTVTPIARRSGGLYELDLALRNNRTTAEHPLGLFHPHAEYHHIKSENIGLIEVMGLAILPARLKRELAAVARGLAAGEPLGNIPEAGRHAEWAETALADCRGMELSAIDERIRTEVGRVFVKVLECCGVFKRDAAGKAAFRRFLESL